MDPTVLPSGNNLTTLSYLLYYQIFLCNFMLRQKEEPANPCWGEEISNKVGHYTDFNFKRKKVCMYAHVYTQINVYTNAHKIC